MHDCNLSFITCMEVRQTTWICCVQTTLIIFYYSNPQDYVQETPHIVYKTFVSANLIFDHKRNMFIVRYWVNDLSPVVVCFGC